jgi:aspartate aminotransferase
VTAPAHRPPAPAWRAARAPEAARATALRPQGAVAIANALLRRRREGKDVIALHDGELDFETPPAVVEATRRALTEGRTRYDDLAGLLELREAVAARLAAEQRVAAGPENVLVTNGSSQAIYEAFQCFVGPGDEVLVPTPAWPTYREGVKMAGGVPVGYRCSAGGLDPDELRRAAGPRAKMIVVNSPHNPTGAVLSRGDLLAVLELAAARDLLVLADEAYDAFVYGGARHVSLAALAGDQAFRVLTMRSFSKTYSMTGFRVGYLYAHPRVIERCAALHAHLSDNVCTFAQYGALAALGLPPDEVARRAGALEERCRLAHAALDPLLPCAPAAGGFYLFAALGAGAAGRDADATAFALRLLDETGVAVVPGDVFDGPGRVRVSLAAAPPPAIEAAAGRLAAFLGRPT